MNTRKTVLAVIEPDINPREVVARAARVAELADAALELLLCDADVGALSDTVFVSNEARDIAGQIRAVQQEMLEELALPARERGVEVATGILDERPIADGIVYVALDRNPLYVVKGTRYHSDAERASLLDTDWQLIRRCPFPLWLVKPRPMTDKPLVIAAVDPMHSHDETAALDRLIVKYASGIADRSDGELHLLHVYQTVSGVGVAANRTFKPIRLSVDEISSRMEKEHREKLSAFAAEHHIDQRHTHLLPGAARDVLPYVARELTADLVVMGAMARSARSGDVLGSTAERALDHLPCDVLILRPDAV